MRVGMYYSNRDVRIQDLPRPKIGMGEILLKVESSGICGSDVMEWYRIDRVPLVLGHEIAGTVEEVGEEVQGFRKGDRVACAHHVPCGVCEYCLHGHETVCETPGKLMLIRDLPNTCASSINVESTFPLPTNVSLPTPHLLSRWPVFTRSKA